MLYKVTGAGQSVCVFVCVWGGGVSEFSGAWGKRGGARSGGSSAS